MISHCYFRYIQPLQYTPMKASLIEQPWFKSHSVHPFWMGVVTLCISLYGVFFLGWSLEPVIWLLWFEVIFAMGAALIRSLFALQGKSFFTDILSRLVTTGVGAFMGIFLLMLTVAFTIKGLDTENTSTAGYQSLRTQLGLLFLNYLLALVLHYFANDRFKTAKPINELMATFLHFFMLLVLIMPITMHLLPKYPQLEQAKWVGLTVIGVKFLLDFGFSRVGKRITAINALVEETKVGSGN